uniref:Uncharacterized protein n=1 Tax=Rhizophora mucronata TaxID=61149 RepID=A0A2P2QJZ9_RHIMU
MCVGEEPKNSLGEQTDLYGSPMLPPGW